MNSFYRDYHNAHAAALELSRNTGRPVGLEATKVYGKHGFCIALIPTLPRNRFGWETRCEVVEAAPPAEHVYNPMPSMEDK